MAPYRVGCENGRPVAGKNPFNCSDRSHVPAGTLPLALFPNSVDAAIMCQRTIPFSTVSPLAGDFDKVAFEDASAILKCVSGVEPGPRTMPAARTRQPIVRHQRRSNAAADVPRWKSDRVRLENALSRSIRVRANGANGERTIFWRTTGSSDSRVLRAGSSGEPCFRSS